MVVDRNFISKWSNPFMCSSNSFWLILVTTFPKLSMYITSPIIVCSVVEGFGEESCFADFIFLPITSGKPPLIKCTAEGTKISKGRAIQNLLNIDSDDKVTAFIRVKKLTTDTEFVNSHYLVFCTKQGVVKKTSLEAYSRPRQNGVNAITIREDDSVIEVLMTNGDCEIVLANRNGRAIRFHESNVREMGRTATGVRGMRIDEDGQDEVIGMLAMDKEDQAEQTIMVVSELGYGKRTRLNDEDGEPVYRITSRGGKGVKTLNITDKTGKLVSIDSVTDDNDLMIINKSGITIRMKVADLRVMGRATQGVKLINLGKRNDEIASVCKVMSDNEDEDEIVDNDIENTENETPEVN